MRCVVALALFAVLSIPVLAAETAESTEKKGSFGVVINENFVKFNYVITYLGESYKEKNLAFRLDFEDNKGFDIPSQINESETYLKNYKNESIQGKVERQSVTSVILLFPLKNETSWKGKAKLYTVIVGYKLKKDFNI
jgi:hypothetical protein